MTAGKITKLQRWLDLIACLVGRKYPVSVDEVLESVPAYVSPHTENRTALDSSKRMFERDKAELRAFGIPIETVAYTIDAKETQEGYRLESRDFYLPYLRLIAEAGAETAPAAPPGADDFEIAPEEAADARAALDHLAAWEEATFVREATSALRKLSFDLPPAEPTPILWAERPEAAETRDRLRVLTDALMARKRVAFGYHGIYRDEATRRDVDGYGLLYRRGNWYLIGYDRLRDDERIFRIDRMEGVRPNAESPETPDYDVPDDFDLAAWRGREPWELGDEKPVRARVLFHFPRSLWVERNGYGEPADEPDPDGGAVRAFDVHQVDPFLRWILSQAGEAEILDPPEMVGAYRDLARRVADLHRDDP